ncbi:DUF2484 family protein [Aestuariivita sp.]|jgi:hypothetical protein|uniref:DUF2484 family protein n=1 Tax=Aestuariivita sp. TaxID=1872407 RepID=UPI00216B6F69|nr:DUF2484 family protein [Aestuariivita sp.]MCE8008917.1 DUF2484 family protein [Aestuariivita sp.]
MSLSIAIAVLWAIASTIVAFLPMRHQYIPGATLMLAAPLVILGLGAQHGWIWVIPAVLGFASMYRNPLRYLWRKWRGHPMERVE